MSRKPTNLAHHPWADKSTVRNRKKKLMDRMKRVIDNSTMPGSEKVFIKGQMKSIFEELRQIDMVHGGVDEASR